MEGLVGDCFRRSSNAGAFAEGWLVPPVYVALAWRTIAAVDVTCRGEQKTYANVMRAQKVMMN